MTQTIERNQSNDLFFTLLESTTILDAKYILQLESKSTNTSKILWLNDNLTVNPQRYDKFIIQEVPLVDEDLEDQKVHLDKDEYTYFVWQTSSDNLDLADADSIIEAGSIKVFTPKPDINIAVDLANVKNVFR